MTHGLENRDFFTPKNKLSWKRLSQELTKDRIKKQTSNFVYKKGTKQFDGEKTLFNHFLPWVNFTNVLLAAFTYVSFACSFFVLMF
jgi:hypothetical protein